MVLGFGRLGVLGLTAQSLEFGVWRPVSAFRVQSSCVVFKVWVRIYPPIKILVVAW